MNDHAHPAVKPNPLTDPVIPALKSLVLVTAADLGVFESIGGGTATADGVARDLRIDHDGVRLLLRALESCGYLESSSGEYRLSPVAADTMTKCGSMCLVNWARFSALQIRAACGLEDVLRTGESVDLFRLMKTDDDRLVHQRAMAETAVAAAEWIADSVPVPAEASRMLDIGGSHGVYSAALCRRNPPMRSSIFELPHMLETARRVSRELGTDRYCDHVGGDFMECSCHEEYDLAFLGNILHHFDYEGAAGLISRAGELLKPEGVIAVWDLAQNSSGAGPVSSLFSMLFHITSAAECFEEEEIRTMLESCGYRKIRRIDPPGGKTHFLIVAGR